MSHSSVKRLLVILSPPVCLSVHACHSCLPLSCLLSLFNQTYILSSVCVQVEGHRGRKHGGEQVGENGIVWGGLKKAATPEGGS